MSSSMFDDLDAGALTARTYEVLLQAAEGRGVAAIAELAAALDARAPYDHEAAEALSRAGQRALPQFREAILEWLGRLDVARGPLSEWLRARLWAAIGESAQALSAWNSVIDHAVGPLAARYLGRSRARLTSGDAAGAAADLREAFRDPATYEEMERGHKLLQRIRQAGAPARQKSRIALLGTFTTKLIRPILELAAFRDGIDAEIYEAEYGVLHQEVLDRASGLHAFKPDLVILATHWRDANLPELSSTPDAAVSAAVAPFIDLWKTLREELRARVIQHDFDIPLVDSYGSLSSSLPGGRARLLRRANLALLDAAGPSVSILDLDAVAAEFGKARWSDSGQWYRAKQHPAPAAIPLLVDHYMMHLRALLGLSRKALVLDLDNVLWGGIVGEDGVDGIRLGMTEAEGEAHLAVQRYARDLKERGIVLAVCSKNNESDAREPFAKHPDMILKLEDFAVFIANWQDKATNLREIARTLDLGTDSLVFLDDNPTERAWVRSRLPEVSVPEIGSDPSFYLPILERYHLFDTLTLSPEDRLRAADYAAQGRRADLRKSSETLEQFISNLQMSATVAPFEDVNLARIAQLVNKSNQFNLTTRRRTEEQLRALSRNSDYVTRSFRLRDRFADNGLIGVIIGRVLQDKAALEIDTWVMSCRVLGRGIEEFMCGAMMDAALSRGLHRMVGSYLPTAKNGLVKDLYARLGFESRPEGEGGQTNWEYCLKTKPVVRNGLVRLESDAEKIT